MMKMKKPLLVILALALAFCLTACQESDESKYSRANKLLNEGKYDDAVKLFDEISTYEDASKMSMYAKAIAAAENGDYKSALQSFKTLGDYKDCPMMITYYSARQYEEQATDVNWSPRIMAAESYDSVGRFLDSKDRAENCRRTVYDEAVRLAELKQYSESMEMLSALRDYEDSALLRRYYEAFSLEQEDKFTEASRAFAALEDYKDSKEQAVEVLKRGYQEADAQERLGKQEEACRLFLNLAESEYEDSFERASKPYYDLGISLRAGKNWADAIRAFEQAGAYSDAETQVKETKYMQACEKREQHNWDAAIELFTALGDYKDSTTVQINETNYQRADALEKEGKQEEAYKLFISLGRYGDSFARANKPYYDLGVAKREAGEWDEAVAAFEHAGTYEDAAEQIKATRYAEGEAKRAAQDWDGAVEIFVALGDYNDALTQIKETRYQEASALESEGKQDAAYTLFLSIGDYKDASERAISLSDELRKNSTAIEPTQYAGATPIPVFPQDQPTPTPLPEMLFTYSTYEAPALHLSFEAPAGWVVDDSQPDRYILTNPDPSMSYAANLMIQAVPVNKNYTTRELTRELSAELDVLGSEKFTTFEKSHTASRKIMESDGVYAIYRGSNSGGVEISGRMMIWCIDNTLYILNTSYPKEYEETYVNQLYDKCRSTIQLNP